MNSYNTDITDKIDIELFKNIEIDLYHNIFEKNETVILRHPSLIFEIYNIIFSYTSKRGYFTYSDICLCIMDGWNSPLTEEHKDMVLSSFDDANKNWSSLNDYFPPSTLIGLYFDEENKRFSSIQIQD